MKNDSALAALPGVLNAPRLYIEEIAALRQTLLRPLTFFLTADLFFAIFFSAAPDAGPCFKKKTKYDENVTEKSPKSHLDVVD